MSNGPIICVIFVHESGYVESWKADEIRAEPDAFKAILEEHRAAGREPLAMRASAIREKPCTCHPDDRPDVCQHKYALADCQKSWSQDQ